MSLAKLLELPGVTAQPEAATQGYVFNHTMIRVKDVAKSLDFYTRVLGFVPVYEMDFPEAEFTNYYLVLRADRAAIPEDDAARLAWALAQPGVLELTYNYGTEQDPAFHYHHGNGEPRGFGHLCVSVPDVKAACERFEQLGVPFQKRLTDGRMKHIAFIKDPDGYWIEILQPTPFAA
ncbi:lactoylglutathione lyase [Frateuria defendens]|uniref:lactoylglutathione lyase n=1 Tax=Frateuria defendens TaxID=2219559 RepID=UPI00066FDCCD|nr:lactoylglutathione lyase [Frateuria defendens]